MTMRNENGRLIDRYGGEMVDGIWHDEPDRVEFKHAGIQCLAKRGPHGNWCGYVGVPPGHPWHGEHGINYREDSLGEVDVHGGITYSAACDHDNGICHVPEPGEPEHLFWQGFDCGGAFDLQPMVLTWSLNRGGYEGMGIGDVYRDLAFVTAEIKRLAEQAQAARLR